jgi:DNA-binding NarL/FixJ family response regulator
MRKITALIADDHQLFREGMESLLLKTPYIKVVHHAANGEQVLKRVKETPIDIIFMDIRMPERNGIETTKMLIKQGSNSKIIALTMMEDTFNVLSMLKSGAHGYLLKNTSFSELKEAIEQVFRNEIYISKNLSEEVREKISQGITESTEVPGSSELSDREKEIIKYICQGFSSKDIGDLLFISQKTVERHRANIYEKLNVHNMADLAFYALQNGLA